MTGAPEPMLNPYHGLLTMDKAATSVIPLAKLSKLPTKHLYWLYLQSGTHDLTNVRGERWGGGKGVPLELAIKITVTSRVPRLACRPVQI